eukprot:jgi/Botrbrau1/16654/Bobra.0068s0070.1
MASIMYLAAFVCCVCRLAGTNLARAYLCSAHWCRHRTVDDNMYTSKYILSCAAVVRHMMFSIAKSGICSEHVSLLSVGHCHIACAIVFYRMLDYMY